MHEGKFVLSDRHPVIVVRHPSRSDDSRTLIATALPETGVLHNKGYIHAAMHAEGTSAAARLALLGLFNTLTVDWWVRRFVDRHITAPVLNQIPLPDWSAAEVYEAAAISSTLYPTRVGSLGHHRRRAELRSRTMGLFKKAAKSAAVVGTAKVVVGAVSKRLAYRRQEKAAAPADEQQQSQPQGVPAPHGTPAPATAAAPAAPSPTDSSLGGQLQQLATLRDQGVLSEDEFTGPRKPSCSVHEKTGAQVADSRHGCLPDTRDQSPDPAATLLPTAAGRRAMSMGFAR